MYFVKTPKFIQSFFKDYIWFINTNKKEIYLTFDDGPTPKVTDFVLRTLKNSNAKATFFCIGKNIEKHPEIFKKIIADGHTIGNHTHNHLNGWKTSLDVYIKNIEKCNLSINTQNAKPQNQNSKLFRPAYGKIKKSQAIKLKSQGYDIVMWSVLSGDFDVKLSKEKCLNNVINNTEKGSIIVFHDSEKAFEKLQYVLPKVLAHFTNAGYIFKSL